MMMRWFVVHAIVLVPALTALVIGVEFSIWLTTALGGAVTVSRRRLRQWFYAGITIVCIAALALPLQMEIDGLVALLVLVPIVTVAYMKARRVS